MHTTNIISQSCFKMSHLVTLNSSSSQSEVSRKGSNARCPRRATYTQHQKQGSHQRAFSGVQHQPLSFLYQPSAWWRSKAMPDIQPTSHPELLGIQRTRAGRRAPSATAELHKLCAHGPQCQTRASPSSASEFKVLHNHSFQRSSRRRHGKGVVKDPLCPWPRILDSSRPLARKATSSRKAPWALQA